jgi:hypothetical protein
MIFDLFYHSGKKKSLNNTMHWQWCQPGASHIHCILYMKRYTDGQGDKQTAISHCGVKLLFWMKYIVKKNLGTKLWPTTVFAGNTVNYSSNKQNSKLFSGVNIQHEQYSTCRGHQKLEKKMYLQSCWKMTPGIFSTTLGLNFQRRKSTRGSIFNVEKWTPGQFSTRFKICGLTWGSRSPCDL